MEARQHKRVNRRTVIIAVCALILVLAGTIWGALQPWSANHFGYALPGNDGLPAYIFANGRRYATLQVCAGADWCGQQRAQQGIPRCYTQADLREQLRLWPLANVAEMFTLFGPPHPILAPAGDHGLTVPFVVADGADCYVIYGLEGGP
jgi:hypothetical protein